MKEGEKKSLSDENDRFLTSCHFIIYIHTTHTRAHILASVSAISARIYKMWRQETADYTRIHIAGIYNNKPEA